MLLLSLSVVCSITIGMSYTAEITPINGWLKFACTPESMKEAGTYFCDNSGKIHCLPGWSDESTLCKVPICEINGQDCIHGNCSKPFTCECEVGWMGQFCDKCICLPGCINGYCNKTFECICDEGWEGMLCDEPVCDDCVHGECVMPGMCICHPGWSGPNCSVCLNRDDCQNGRCVSTPFECVCYDGYYGPSCEFAICKQGCHPHNGRCMMPDTCWCKYGWQGRNCTQCVPYWNCVHGYCNKPWECICEEGYFGQECNETKHINGQWGQWADDTPCSVTCGNGTKVRRRHCDNPPKSGNGSYCSVDGSASTEVVVCNLGPCDDPSTWGPWGSYSPCSTSCGAGTQTRTRTCGSPTGYGTTCSGDSSETRACKNNPPCPVDGGYSEWTQFSPCTATCVDEAGTTVRRRYCTNPAPKFGGKTCLELGPNREELPCFGTVPRQYTDPLANCFTIYT